MTLYTAAKWRTARLTRYSFRLAMAVAMVLGLIALVLCFVSLTPWIDYTTQRDIGLVFLLLENAIFVPMVWSRFHLGRRRPSLQLYVENSDLISFHWTPLPEWLRKLAPRSGNRDRRTIPVIPRREALAQFHRWIVDAHAKMAAMSRQVRLDSALFLTRATSGATVPRAALQRFAEVIANVPQVASVNIGPPHALTADRAMFYRLFWPSAARNACRSEDGRILAGGLVLRLTDKPISGAAATGDCRFEAASMGPGNRDLRGDVDA